MAQAVSANRLELLQIADAVAREKSIERELVLEAMAEAIQKAAKSRYGAENDIRARIDPNTGEIRLVRLLDVVDAIENDATEILVVDAQRRNPAARAGDLIEDELPPVDFGGTIACRVKFSGPAIAFAPTSMTCVASSADRRFSCRAHILNSWPNSSVRKCLKFMMASSR